MTPTDRAPGAPPLADGVHEVSERSLRTEVEMLEYERRRLATETDLT